MMKTQIQRQSVRVWWMVVVSTVVKTAYAGMTVYGLNDIYRTRLEELSFFIVVFLVSTFTVKGLWNLVAKDIACLPKLKFRHAAAVSLMFGMGVLLILTMISGIREVLTPEAWRRQGSAYRLNSPVMVDERRWHIQQLRDELARYARQHEGQYPPHDFVEEIPPKLWTTPDRKGIRYHYRPGLSLSDGERVVAWEPAHFGDELFAVTAAGEVRQVSAAELARVKSTAE